jgi:ribosome-associated protein
LDISVVDVSKYSSVTDYFVVATSESSPQTNAITKSVDDALKKIGVNVPMWQGKLESNWIILDLGSTIIHIMGPEERKKYSLEELWEKTSVTYHI